MRKLVILLSLVLLNYGCSQTRSTSEKRQKQLGASGRVLERLEAIEPSVANAFLKLAGSLEKTGRPEGYIRHVHAEQKRLAQKYEKTMGKKAPSMLPSYLTEEHSEKLIANWNALAPKLGLEAMLKENGRMMRDGMSGTQNRGTIAISLLNQHQARVLADPSGGAGVGYEELKVTLVKGLQLDKRKHDYKAMNSAEEPAVLYANLIRGRYDSLFKKIDAAVPADQAKKIKSVILTMVEDLGRLAHAEFQLGTLGRYLDGQVARR